MANHALVLMFYPLYEDYSQPIAVFTSNGPMSGDTLAKIVVQAIVLLENAGAKIHGVISDGGGPNRKMWNVMGCCRKMDAFKNYFQHPLDDKRKVFIFLGHSSPNEVHSESSGKCWKINGKTIDQHNLKT